MPSPEQIQSSREIDRDVVVAERLEQALRQTEREISDESIAAVKEFATRFTWFGNIHQPETTWDTISSTDMQMLFEREITDAELKDIERAYDAPVTQAALETSPSPSFMLGVCVVFADMREDYLRTKDTIADALSEQDHLFGI